MGPILWQVRERVYGVAADVNLEMQVRARQYQCCPERPLTLAHVLALPPRCPKVHIQRLRAVVVRDDHVVTVAVVVAAANTTVPGCAERAVLPNRRCRSHGATRYYVEGWSSAARCGNSSAGWYTGTGSSSGTAAGIGSW